MMRLNLLLLLLVVLSALYLVTVQYESRKLYAELDRARALAHRLDVDNERLQLEKRAQASAARIERLARTRLQMRPLSPAVTVYVARGASAAQ